MIGICTQYRRSESAQAALAVARHLDDAGRPSEVLGHGWRVGAVDHAYDHRVKSAPLHDWLRGVDHVVWTTAVEDYPVYVPQDKRLTHTLYTSWDKLNPHDAHTLGAYQHVVVPTPMQAIQVRDRFGIKNVAVLPFDCGYPITKKRTVVEPDKINVCLPLYGSTVRRAGLAVVRLLADVVRDHKNVCVKVVYSSGLAPHTTAALNSFVDTYKSRWDVVQTQKWHEHQQIIGDSDLTIWPTQWDGLGLVGLASLHAGTPVFAWDAAPMNEHLANGRNAVLVSCGVEYDWLGVPHVVPDYAEFDRILRWLLDSPSSLAELRSHTHERLYEWVSEFHKGLEVLLPPG
jgi:glycosyltransferase involved in cell wall biosynthesis